MKSIIGRKIGMTEVFATDGTMYPVTVIEVLPNVVVAKKTNEKDGYEALQVGYEPTAERHLNKCELGIYKKANVEAHAHLFELKATKSIPRTLAKQSPLIYSKLVKWLMSSVQPKDMVTPALSRDITTTSVQKDMVLAIIDKLVLLPITAVIITVLSQARQCLDIGAHIKQPLRTSLLLLAMLKKVTSLSKVEFLDQRNRSL